MVENGLKWPKNSLKMVENGLKWSKRPPGTVLGPINDGLRAPFSGTTKCGPAPRLGKEVGGWDDKNDHFPEDHDDHNFCEVPGLCPGIMIYLYLLHLSLIITLFLPSHVPIFSFVSFSAYLPLIMIFCSHHPPCCFGGAPVTTHHDIWTDLVV